MIDLGGLKDEILTEHDTNVAQKVREYVEKLDYGEDFYLNNLDTELQIRSDGYKPARMQELGRLVKKKVLRKFRDKPGRYRKLQPIDIIEWWNAPDDPLKIYLPFGLSNDKGIHIKIFSGSVIVLAGRQESGKTSVAQEFIEENIDINPLDEKIRYLVNDSGGPEIKYRLTSNAGLRPEVWRERVIVINRTRDFADAINPDGINVIDFLTDYQEAWGIGRQMEEIYEVVRNSKGMVWINLQKDYDRDTARGGPVTLDIPRLYLSMDYDRIKIIKAKLAGGDNPKRMVHNFDVAEDGTIMPRGIWHFPASGGGAFKRWGG